MIEDYKFCYICKQSVKLPDGSFNELEKKLKGKDMKDRSSTICPECYKSNHPKFYENWRLKEYNEFYEVYNKKSEEWRKI